MFRIWILLSVGWISIKTYDQLDRIWSPYIPQKEYQYYPELGKFAPHQEEKDPIKWLNFVSDFRTLEFKNNLMVHIPNAISNEKAKILIQKFETDFVQLRDSEVHLKRQENLWSFIRSAFGPPIALLFIGAACVWAFSGFLRSERK